MTNRELLTRTAHTVKCGVNDLLSGKPQFRPHRRKAAVILLGSGMRMADVSQLLGMQFPAVWKIESRRKRGELV